MNIRHILFAVLFAIGGIAGVEAAPTDVVTQADLQALLARLGELEKINKAQAEKISQLEKVQNENVARINDFGKQATEINREFKLQTDRLTQMSTMTFSEGETTTNETGRIYTTGNGKKYYLADASARIFEPLTESGLQFTPYGYLVFEGVYSDRPLDCDWAADFVMPRGQQSTTTLSMQDSILGMQFMTPEAISGWKFGGKAEFDLAGSHENQYAFHWRHLYVDAAHESGWSILFGQTWHLWKMVSPSEIDSSWMENAGHPYRRSPQLRVTKNWDWEDSSLNVRVGIVKGGPGMGGDRDSDMIQDNSSSPWVLFEGAVVYDRDSPWQNKADDLQTQRWLVGFGGMYGRDRSHQYGYAGQGYALNSETGAIESNAIYDYCGDNDDYDSMMGMFAMAVPIWRFKLQGQIYAGENLGGIQAGCAQTVLYHNWGSGYVRGNEVRTVGGFIDLSYRLTEKWMFALGWGCDNPFNSDVEGAATADGYYGIMYNDRAYVDAFYQVTTNFKLGVEYARLLTAYADENHWGDPGGDYAADRVQFSAFYDF